jgi:hypothetical protein
MTSTMALQMRYDLSPSLANILLLLVKNKVVNQEMVEVEYRLTKDTKVAMHRLRHRLKPHGIEVASMRDVGYWLDIKTRRAIYEAIKDEKEELSFGDEDNGSGDPATGAGADSR